MRLRDKYAPSKEKGKDPYLVGVVVDLDLEKLQEDGYSHLLKSVSQYK